MDVKKLSGLIENMSSGDYHSHSGSYSSSQLKSMLEDPESFYKKYIEKSEERLSIPAFDIGTYFHTAILEPEKLVEDCAVYTGIRRGKAWDEFKVANSGKAIITESELVQAKGLVKAVQDSTIAMGRISQGRPEISAFVDLTVFGGDVYNSEGDILGNYGWEPYKTVPNKKRSRVLTIKTRADLLADEFILDLKSTTGNAKNEHLMRTSVSKYSYDLSAALYLDVFSIATGRVMSEFVWTFASKDCFNSKSYVASSDNIRIGRAKWKKAIVSLAECMDAEWKFVDSLGELKPNMFEYEHIKQKAEDLI